MFDIFLKRKILLWWYFVKFSAKFSGLSPPGENYCVFYKHHKIKNASARSFSARPVGGSWGALDLTAHIGAKTRSRCVHSVPHQLVFDCPSCGRRWELLGVGDRKDRQEGNWRIFLDLGTRCGWGTLRTRTLRVSPIEGLCSGKRKCWYPQGVLVLILLWKYDHDSELMPGFSSTPHGPEICGHYKVIYIAALRFDENKYRANIILGGSQKMAAFWLRNHLNRLQLVWTAGWERQGT